MIYRHEPGEDHDVVRVSYSLTRGHPADGPARRTSRIGPALRAEVAWPPRQLPYGELRCE
ncbi:MAG: hypothetical protein WAK82_09760 [Streptosporangiaceae bacterium]